MRWPEDSKLAFSQQSHMQELRPARPKAPRLVPGPRLRAVGVGMRRQWGSHSTAVWWLVWSFPVSPMKEEGKKNLFRKQTPLQIALQDTDFTGSEPDILLAVRVSCALDTRLLTKQRRVASAPCPHPGLLPHHCRDMAHPEEGPPERTPGPLESPWRCSSGYPDGVGRSL